MLNYIWAGLIVSSLVFALFYDGRDLARDTYRNGEPLPVTLVVPGGADPTADRQAVTVRIDTARYKQFYDTDAVPDTAYAGTLVTSASGRQLRFAADAALPEPLAQIRDSTNPRDKVLQGALGPLVPAPAGAPEGAFETTVTFDPVRFVKLNAISAAALSFAETAVTLALGLIGVLALFLGLMKIAEQAGVIQALVRVVRPLLRPLFPDIPRDHPAMGLIALNLAANVFGLGNAATPFGIKAMESLQELNPVKDTATNAQVMLLAMNTASVQLVPPVLLIALIGMEINQVIFAIIFTTTVSLFVAITAAKLLSRLPAFRRSDPLRAAPDAAPGAPPSTPASPTQP
ncbi:MAG: nucleoside recognition domain-containing protein [Rubricoccaceae bacterium]